MFRVISYFKYFSNISHIYFLDSDVFNELPCPGCNCDLEQCCCQKLTEIVKSTNMKLLEMQLIDRLAGSGLTDLIKLKIKEHINDTCLGVFDRSHLKQLETVSGFYYLVERFVFISINIFKWAWKLKGIANTTFYIVRRWKWSDKYTLCVNKSNRQRKASIKPCPSVLERTSALKFPKIHIMEIEFIYKCK